MIIKTTNYTPKLQKPLQENSITIFNDLVKIDRENLICIAARPGMGKTSLVLYMALEYAMKSDKVVYIYSLDQCAEQLYEQLLCSLTCVDIYAMRNRNFTDGDREKICCAIERLQKLNIVIDDEDGLTARNMIDRLRGVNELGLVIVDSSRQETDAISHEMRNFSMRKNTPVIFTHTLNRTVEKRKNRRPILSDMYEYGTLEPDSDTVIFLYRNEYYETPSENRGKAEIIIAKNRYAPTDTVLFDWYGQYMKFSESAKEN